MKREVWSVRFDLVQMGHEEVAQFIKAFAVYIKLPIADANFEKEKMKVRIAMYDKISMDQVVNFVKMYNYQNAVKMASVLQTVIFGE